MQCRSTDAALGRLLNLVEKLRTVDPTMPIQTAFTLLLIAENDGMQMSGIQDRLELSAAAVSRNILSLSHYRQDYRAGHGLVRTEPDPTERRRKIVFLTKEGKRFVASLLEEMLPEPQDDTNRKER